MSASHDDRDISRAFALTEQMMNPQNGEGGALSMAKPLADTGKTIRYWLWRLRGRKRPGGEAAKVAATYEHEIERLNVANARALSRQRDRVAQLEQLTNQLQRAFQRENEKLRAAQATEVERLRAELARMTAELEQALIKAAVSPAAELERAQARKVDAEERARLAENKVEMLKEALDITRARAGNSTGTGEPIVQDRRFREAKRAFARAFHPDQGGRTAPDKQRIFQEFWPVLERIERGE